MTNSKFIDQDGYKTCRMCEQVLPATFDYFYCNDRMLSRLGSYCKKCDNHRRSIAEKEKKYHNIPANCVFCGKFYYASRSYLNKVKKRKCSPNSLLGRHCSMDCAKKNPKVHFGMKGWSWDGKRKDFNNPNSKYSVEQVKQIKHLLNENHKVSDISKMVGMTASSIYKIKQGKRYADVTI